MTSTHHLPLGTALVGLALGLTACGDAAPAPTAIPAAPDAPAQQTPAAETPPPVAQAPETHTPAAAVRQLVIEGDVQRFAQLGEPMELAVHYLDAYGAPLPGGRIHARLLDATGADRSATGIEGTALAGLSAYADNDGRAVFRLLPGRIAAGLRVEASADGAAPVTWQVQVAAPETGALEVHFSGAAEAMDHGQVVVFTGFGCETLAESPEWDRDAVAVVDADMDAVGGRGLVPALDAGTYSVVARTTNPQGYVTGWGCVGGVAVAGGQQTRIDIALDGLGLEMKGRYALEQTLDLGEALTGDGQQAEALALLAAIGGGYGDGANPRGRAIADLGCERVGANDLICGVIRGVGAPIIEDVIDENVDPQVLSALDMLGDVYRLVRELTILGEIEITAAGADDEGRISGNDHRWERVRILWRNDCPFVDERDCTFEIGFDEMGGRQRAVAGAFDAILTDRGRRLAIQPHAVSLRLADLVRVVAEHWLIPATLGRPGPVPMADLAAELLPCQQINNLLPLDRVCETVLAPAMADLVSDALGDALGETPMVSLSGAADLVDDNGDRVVDGLRDGTWTGEISVGGRTAQVSGTFDACRGACAF